MTTQYIEHPETKEQIPFEWNNPNPPTSADIDALLSSVSKRNESVIPSISKTIPEPYPTTNLEKFMGGMGKGFVDIGRGIGQRVGLVSPQEIEESRKLDEPLMKSTAGKIGHFAGSVLPWMAIPGGAPTSLLGRIGVGAATGAGMGLIQPTTEKESPLLNVATGTALGGILPVGLAGISKVYGAIKEPVKGATAELGRKFGIRTTLGEVTGHPMVQRMESWLEEIPVIGLKKFRDKQQDETKQAVTNFLTQYVKDPSATDWTTGGRQFASTLYKDLKTTLPGIDQQIINHTETRTVAKTFLERYPDIFKKFQDTKRENILMDIVKGVEEKIPARIYSPTGQMLPSTIPKNLTFEEAWYLRHGLGEMIGQARKKLASGEIDKTTFSQMKTLFSAVDNDINKWASSIGKPNITDAIVSANDAYKQYVVKADLFQRAMERKNVYTTDGFLSPQKFSNTLRDIIKKDKYYGTFSKTELDEMTGLSNIMHIVQRAGQFKENPPTGRRWGPLLFLGLVREAGTVASLPITMVSKFLTGTEAGKRLVLSASKIEPQNPAMAKIMEEIYRQVPRMGGMEGAQIGVGNKNTLPPQIPLTPRSLGGPVSPVTIKSSGRTLPPGIISTKGVLSKPETKNNVNHDMELSWIRDAISQGAPADQARAMFKTRTGREYTE